MHRRTSVALENLSSTQLEERRKLGLVRFSLAMDDMRRLVDQAGFAEHEDEDEEADSARNKAGILNKGNNMSFSGSVEDLENSLNGDGDGKDEYSGASTATRTENHRPSFG